MRDNAHEKLAGLLTDNVPEVRCAALFALGTFINQSDSRAESLDHTVGIQICKMSNDPSPMVREVSTDQLLVYHTLTGLSLNIMGGNDLMKELNVR